TLCGLQCPRARSPAAKCQAPRATPHGTPARRTPGATWRSPWSLRVVSLGLPREGRRPGSDRYRRSGPLRGLLIGSEQKVQIDGQRVAIPLDGETIHVPRGPSGDERSIGLVLRPVTWALEARILRSPTQRRMLVRAREIEREDLPMRSDDDHILVAIDGRAVGRWNRI